MDKPPNPVSTEGPAEFELDDDLPPGDHPLEVAARQGMGPLSPRGRETWHGDAVPCVTCGQLVLREKTECDHCGQDLSEEMVEKMRTHAGPWYVLEHVRPFPGVSLERIARQIRRGFLTETSIVRGPASDYQWRFAVETPGLCRYFSRCWQCHEEVSQAEVYCPGCLALLTFEQGRAGVAAPPAKTGSPAAAPQPEDPPATAGSPPGQSNAISGGRSGFARHSCRVEPDLPALPLQQTPELRALSAALGGAELPARNQLLEAPLRIGGIPVWVAAVAMLLIVIAGLAFVSQCRRQDTNGASSPPPTPGVIFPLPHINDR